MRQAFFLFFIILGSYSLLAQPDLDQAHLFRLGDSGDYLGLDATGVQPGAAGQGVTWDFSQLSHKPEDNFKIRFDRPDAAPNLDQYPGTDLVIIRTEEDVIIYDYLDVRGARTFGLGSDVSNVGVFRFTDVSFYPSFPISFNQTNADPIGGSYQFTSIFGPTGTSTLKGTTSVHYDGFGTIILPDDRQIEEVRRVKFVREWDEVGTIAGVDVTAHQKQTRYHFIEGDLSVPIFELIFTEQAVTPAGGATTTQNTQSAAYRVKTTSNPTLTARRGAHLTTQSGAFNSQIIVHNPTDSSQTLSLQPINDTGNFLAKVDVSLAPGATSRVFAKDYFSTEAKSFLAEGCLTCTFSVGYRANVANASTAQVHQTKAFQKTFIFYPGEWQYLFDGQAIINTSDRSAKITASQIDYNGNLLGTVNLETALESGGKHLSLINDQFANNPNSIIKLESDELIGVMVLRISNDFRFLYQNNPLPDFVNPNASRWLPHITSDGGGFGTDILVHNRGDLSQTVTFHPFDQNGNALSTVEVMVPAGGTQRFAKMDLFASSTSHAAITGSTDCVASVGFRALAPNASTAFIHESPPVNQSFKLFPGEWDLIVDGLALINTGNAPATISLTQFGDNGQALNTVELVNELAPNAKYLGLLAGLVPDNANTIIQIEATQPLAILSLRLSEDNLFLYNNEILPQ